jgi:hypothetical protein
MTAEHALTDLFESSDWAAAPNPQAAAMLTTQWLRDAGFLIRAPPFLLRGSRIGRLGLNPSRGGGS